MNAGARWNLGCFHSDETLLDTGFIFFFNFFQTRLRPAAVPLDPVVFVGHMPLERFQGERPLENMSGWSPRVVSTG